MTAKNRQPMAGHDVAGRGLQAASTWPCQPTQKRAEARAPKARNVRCRPCALTRRFCPLHRPFTVGYWLFSLVRPFAQPCAKLSFGFGFGPRSFQGHSTLFKPIRGNSSQKIYAPTSLVTPTCRAEAQRRRERRRKSPCASP